MIVAGGRDKKQDGGSVDAVSIQKLISSVANDNVPGGRVSAAYWRVRAFVGRADSVRASVAFGGVCALVAAVLVVGCGLLM